MKSRLLEVPVGSVGFATHSPNGYRHTKHTTLFKQFPPILSHLYFKAKQKLPTTL